MKPAQRRISGAGGREGNDHDAVLLPSASLRQHDLADPVEVVWARAETRAYLIAVGEIDDPGAYFTELAVDVAKQVERGTLDLHVGVDALQELVVFSGLLADLGQDRVQALMAEAFDSAASNLRLAA